MSGKGTDEKVTAVNAAEWLKRKADNTVDDELPSGLAIKRKKQVSIESLAFSGRLPLTLVQELQDKGEAEIDLDEVLQNIDQYGQLIDAVFCTAMVSPKIGNTTNLDEGTIALSEFDDEITDKIYIFGKVLSATNALKPFRGQHGANGASAPPRKRVRKPTKRNPKD